MEESCLQDTMSNLFVKCAWILAKGAATATRWASNLYGESKNWFYGWGICRGFKNGTCKKRNFPQQELIDGNWEIRMIIPT